MTVRSINYIICLIALIIQNVSAEIAQTQFRPWTNYQVIMWTSDSAYKNPEKIPLFFQRLKEMGVTASMVYDDQNPSHLLKNNFPYYVENIINRGLCLKWNSKVTNWEKFISQWMLNRSESAFIRDYCLDDPQWLNWAKSQMQRVVSKNMKFNPLAYDIRDELSVTISANPFDYDFNPITLNNFRQWLKTNYGTIQNLNNQWETSFQTWDNVKPFSTDQIKNRMASAKPLPEGKPDWQALQKLKFDPVSAKKEPTKWNFSPWCDFRTYMDISLATALNEIRKASHAIDPFTPVGIEGTQMPHAFGGYDLWRLANVLDWVEPYDIACSREIFGSFMPGKIFLTTVFEKNSLPAIRRLWHLLLLGDRGCIIWWSEDCIDWKNPDYPLTPKALELSIALKEITSPLAKIFMLAERIRDPIAIYYSQPSIQVDWLLESTVDGATWVRRFSSYEAAHNKMAKFRNSWLKIFQDLGYSPYFISSEQLCKNNQLTALSALVLTCSLAISDEEVNKVINLLTTQANKSCLVFSDCAPAIFDEHGKLRKTYPLENIFPPVEPGKYVYVATNNTKVAIQKPGDISLYAKQRLSPEPSLEWAKWIKEIIQSQQTFKNLKQEVEVAIESRTRVHRFKLKYARLLAFERNIDYFMSEDLKQAGGNEALEKPINLTARLAQKAHIYDLRKEQYVGYTDTLSFTLDPYRPSLFALLNEKIQQQNIINFLSSQLNYPDKP